MTVTWDAPNKQFVYSVKRGPTTVTVELRYTFSDTDPPGVDHCARGRGGFRYGRVPSNRPFVQPALPDITGWILPGSRKESILSTA
jgi:hypothetical protein